MSVKRSRKECRETEFQVSNERLKQCKIREFSFCRYEGLGMGACYICRHVCDYIFFSQSCIVFENAALQIVVKNYLV